MFQKPPTFLEEGQMGRARACLFISVPSEDFQSIFGLFLEQQLIYPSVWIISW